MSQNLGSCETEAKIIRKTQILLYLMIITCNISVFLSGRIVKAVKFSKVWGGKPKKSCTSSSQGLIPTPFSQIKIQVKVFSEISCYAPPCLPPSVLGSWTVSLKPPCGQTLGSQQTEACCFRKPQSLHTQAVSPPLTCLWLHQLLSVMSSFRVWLQPKLQGGTSHLSHESRMTVSAVKPKQEADKRQWFCLETRGGNKNLPGCFLS